MDLAKIRKVAEQYKAINEKMKEVGIISANDNSILIDHVVEGMKVTEPPFDSACKGHDKVVFAIVEIGGLVFKTAVYDTDPEYAGLVAEWKNSNVPS